MLRCSSAGKICTHRPSFNQDVFDEAYEKLRSKVGDDFDMEKIEEYSSTKGIMTVAKEFLKQIEKKKAFENDELPMGAKSHLQEVWLQNETGFVDVSFEKGNQATKKGNYVEDDAILMLAGYYDLPLVKNEERRTLGFLSGEPDMIYEKDGLKYIRDNKSPETWKTFRAKRGIEDIYYWQLIAYCYLFGAQAAFLDYTLMPFPVEMVQEMLQYMSEIGAEKFLRSEEVIRNLPSSTRVKSFSIPPNVVAEDIIFFKSRLDKAEAYYKSLDYNTCMKMINNE